MSNRTSSPSDHPWSGLRTQVTPAPDGGQNSRGPLSDGPHSSDHFYLPRPAADDLRALASSGAWQELQPEVDLVRVVLRRLLAYMDESAGALSPEEARRIAGLLFTGARTVALLLGKRPARPAETQDWMAAALGEMGEEVGREL